MITASEIWVPACAGTTASNVTPSPSAGIAFQQVGPARIGACPLAKRQNSVSYAPLTAEPAQMKNYLDGGEAILEAFRKLKIDYIMSSPGSEWSPIWEALARQKIENRAGPIFVES